MGFRIYTTLKNYTILMTAEVDDCILLLRTSGFAKVDHSASFLESCSVRVLKQHHLCRLHVNEVAVLVIYRFVLK